MGRGYPGGGVSRINEVCSVARLPSRVPSGDRLALLAVPPPRAQSPLPAWSSTCRPTWAGAPAIRAEMQLGLRTGAPPKRANAPPTHRSPLGCDKETRPGPARATERGNRGPRLRSPQSRSGAKMCKPVRSAYCFKRNRPVSVTTFFYWEGAQGWLPSDRYSRLQE